MIFKRNKFWHMDVTIRGIRYREALHTTDRREALSLEKQRVANIQQGRGASKSGREFARLPFADALRTFLMETKLRVAERTVEHYEQRGRRLVEFFGTTPLLRIKASAIAQFQTKRVADGVKNRTINMEITVLRLVLRRAKLWLSVAEDVKMLPEGGAVVGKVLNADQKRLLFQTAASNDAWMVAFCAGVVAVNTTCRGVEVRNLRWQDVDLFAKLISIRRSKTEAGHRTIPLNRDAIAAVGRLWERAQALGSTSPEHFVFPACEGRKVNPEKPQRGWRTAWRSLRKETARRAGRAAALEAITVGGKLSAAKAAYRASARVFEGFRFHDLRHQAITELAESGATDATLMALAGHMSRKMLEHYSHTRMEAKRVALDGLASGLITSPEETEAASQETVN